MATLVIKTFPEELHNRLKSTAAAHRRSVTQETIYLLEKALLDEGPMQVESYWENREILPELQKANDRGAFSNATESTESISEEREDR